MANRMKNGNESALMKSRHGQEGYIVWRIEVLPELKSQFVELAEKNGTTLKVQVNEALESFLKEYNG